MSSFHTCVNKAAKRSDLQIALVWDAPRDMMLECGLILPAHSPSCPFDTYTQEAATKRTTRDKEEAPGASAAE